MYAGRKRKKPVPKRPKPPPLEGVKSNPSKRHRDRLNQELSKLTGLLPFPEDVRTRLDKLSILRLAVGYLKVKSYLLATAMDVGDYVLEQPRAPEGSRWMDPQVNRELFPEGELLLQALNGFVIAVTGDGCIFYISPTVQDYLGFHQSDLIHQSVYELIHVDDRATFHHQLHRTPVSSSSQHAFPIELLAGCSTTSSPEEPSLMERSFTCRFRCLLNNSSGFLALRFHGRLKCLLGQQKSPSDRSPFVFFAIATVLQPFSILELRTKTLIFQTKHKLDFTPVACDSQDEEGEENLWKRNLQLPFTFVTGEGILNRNDLPEPLDSFQSEEEPQRQAHCHPKQCLVDRNPLLGPMMKQDASIYSSHADNVLQLIAELDGLSQDEVVSDAKDSDSLLVIIETLFEKSEVDGNISQALQSLNMDTAELQWWEDALLSLGTEDKSPVQKVGTGVTSYMEQMFLGQDAGKSMAFPPCNEEDGAAAHLQHCWAAHSVFQAPAQPRAPGAQGQDAVVPLVSISSAQPEQQVLSNPAELMGGTLLDASLELAKPGQGLQARVPTSAPMDNTVPNDDIQPGGKLVGSSCPPPLHSNTPVTQWHNVSVQANPGNALGQSTSGGCQQEAWIALKHLEAAGTQLESQPVLAGSPENFPGAGLWLLPSQPAPCSAQGLHESLFSHGDLHEEEAVLPAQASPEDGGFPKEPYISHLEPSLSWEGEQAVFQEDKWSMQWLLQARAAPCCSGADPVQHSSLLLGSSVGPTLPDHVVLPECQYGNSLFRHESNFLRDTPKISLPQHPVGLPCPSESHPRASPGLALRFSASFPTKVGAGALEQGPGFPSASSFTDGQPPCACEVQLKVRCEGCRT
ncbi:uncharacterized protein LOC136009648 isoform X4 [Lathamus discolor]|uniref:uncharacterized protein LOC136009648 isoform X4 n=1 Tax=Lathamus discolor TaxID=678569 RepID=UPI0032B818DA